MFLGVIFLEAMFLEVRFLGVKRLLLSPRDEYGDLPVEEKRDLLYGLALRVELVREGRFNDDFFALLNRSLFRDESGLDEEVRLNLVSGVRLAVSEPVYVPLEPDLE